MEPSQIAFTVFGLLASLFVISSFSYLTFKLFQTKSTHGLSTLFTLSMVVAGIAWITYGILTVVDGEGSSDSLIAGLPIMITNVVATLLSVASLLLKYKMVQGAKKNNMTEKEYCDLVWSKKQASK